LAIGDAVNEKMTETFGLAARTAKRSDAAMVMIQQAVRHHLV